MKRTSDIEVLFVAGFGPIVPDSKASNEKIESPEIGEAMKVLELVLQVLCK